MRDLKRLVSELAEAQKLADTDLEAVPWQTRASMTSMVRDARDRLDRLKAEYCEAVRANTLGLFMFGDPVRIAEFMEIAAAEAGVIMLQGDDLYQMLADRVEASIGAQREFGPTQLQGLLLALQDVTKQLDIRAFRNPTLTGLRTVPDRVSLVQYIRELVRNAVGDDLLRMHLHQAINQKAVDEQFTGKIFPVGIVGLSPDEVPSLVPLFTTSISVEVGTSSDGEIDKEYVLSRLKDLRRKFKSKNN